MAEVSAAGANSLVMVDGSAGLLDIDNTVMMSYGQALVGGGTQLEVVGVNSGATALFTVPGVCPTINGTNPSNSVFEIGDFTTIQGLDITGGRFGIRGGELRGFLVADNRVSGAVDIGIYVSSVGDGSTIRGNTASGNLVFGLVTEDMSGGTVSGNMASGNEGDGFTIDPFDGGTFNNNVATDNGGAGYDVMGAGGTATGNTGSGNGSNNVYP